MAMIAFRTDEQLEQRLQDAARKQKKSRTEIIREALDLYLEGARRSATSKPNAHKPSIAEVLKEDIGIWDGPEDASVQTGGKLGEILLEKQRTRRM